MCFWSSGVANCRSEKSASRPRAPCRATGPSSRPRRGARESSRSRRGRRRGSDCEDRVDLVGAADVDQRDGRLGAQARARPPCRPSASCRRSGPFSVVFQSWMLSERACTAATQASREPEQRASDRTTCAPMRTRMPRRLRAPSETDVSHAMIAASRHCRSEGLRITSRHLMISWTIAGAGIVRRASRGAEPRMVRRGRWSAASRWPGRAGRRRRRSTIRSWAGWGSTARRRRTSAAIYWNPAALGLVRGSQVMVAGTARWSSTTVGARASIRDGLPGRRARAAPVRDGARHDASPCSGRRGRARSWRISSDVGGDRFTLGFATYMPYLEQTNSRSRRPATSRPATRR